MSDSVPSLPSRRSHRPEVWLRTNRRALIVAVWMTLFLVVTGASAVAISPRSWLGAGLSMAGWTTAVVAGVFAAMLVYQMSLPRLAYSDGCLLVYLQSASPIRVPIEIVELFFTGQGGSHIPQATDAPSKSRTVVVRLAEAATDWHFREVKADWGEWREGYIIIRGTWCEPLTVDVLKRLNRRLREVHRELCVPPLEA